jgi:hypothetical protein
MLGFYHKGAKFYPRVISSPSYALKNHKSLVNSVLSHPELPCLVTAGVEKVFRFFSAWPMHGFVGPIPEECAPDLRVIEYFDRLVILCNTACE